MAFARAFRVPIAWFLTPPSAWEGVGVSTPCAGEEGLDPIVMLDAVLGTPETLEDYKQYLFSWPDPGHRMRVYADGSTEYLGRVQETCTPASTSSYGSERERCCGTSSATSTAPAMCFGTSLRSWSSWTTERSTTARARRTQNPTSRDDGP
ncbi:MAG: hypothetical protein ACRD2W_20080 [Acidimicrobiales bacterium]